MMGGPGMMGGYGMMGGAYGIELSKDQRKSLYAIQDETRKAHFSMMAAMMDEQAKLRDLYLADKPDKDAIATAYGRIGEIQQSMYKSMIDAQQKMDALLTDEQRERLRRPYR